MSADASAAPPARSLWNELFPGSRDSVTAMRIKDGLAIALAAVLPWSTSGVAILAVLFVLSLLPTLDVRMLQVTLKRPAGFIPVLFFVLGIAGLLWVSDATQADRLGYAGQLGKLLLIPLLFYHFSRSRRSAAVFAGFVLSCCVLLVWSWLNWLYPNHVPVIEMAGALPGVPIKNYITQSQEFALCAFILAGLAFRQMQAGQSVKAIATLGLAILFVADMLFVVSARTALVYLPVMLAVFALRHLRLRAILAVTVGAVIVAALSWFTSPFLRSRVETVAIEYQAYRQTNAVTSTGERLEFWRKSLKFIAEAPFTGHGTGSIRRLFEKDAIGQTGVSAEVIGNPHNQTLHTVIQWGLLGGVLLYAMWISHFALFLRNGLISWIGLIAVVENVTSSLLNSHIADFNEGWLYVLAVGVAGGFALKSRGVATTEPFSACDVEMPGRNASRVV